MASFDTVPHDLLVKAVEAHTDAVWVRLYVRRWLTAPLQLPDGTLRERDRGTPQGSAVSPVLANLFMHYALDLWLTREFPTVKFERYADDAVVHCATERQAVAVRQAIEDRLVQVGLRLHPDKTKIVYCRDGRRKGTYPHTSFTFLGYTFRARTMRGADGKSNFTGFAPAISKDALKKLTAEARGWKRPLRGQRTFAGLARKLNPIIRGWMQYYGRFYRTALYPVLRRINSYLVRWLRQTHRRFQGWRKAIAYWNRVVAQAPHLFAHWQWTTELVR